MQTLRQLKELNILRVFLLALVTTMLMLGPLPSVRDVEAQSIQTQLLRLMDATSVGHQNATVTSAPAIWVKYIGSSADGEVAVDAATGDLTFISGANGSEAASTSFECPVSGALGGVIDVSDASCNTVDEVLEIINASSDWRAGVITAMLTDSSNNTLNTQASTSAKSRNGVVLYNDGAVSFHHSVLLAPTPQSNRAPFWASLAGSSNTLNWTQNPFDDSRTVVDFISGVSTYGSGTSTINVYASTLSQGATVSETVRTIYTAAGGATTVAATPTLPTNGIRANEGERVIVRIVNSAAMTAASLTATGYQYR